MSPPIILPNTVDEAWTQRDRLDLAVILERYIRWSTTGNPHCPVSQLVGEIPIAHSVTLKREATVHRTNGEFETRSEQLARRRISYELAGILMGQITLADFNPHI